MRTALYARVSTLEQDPENQLLELRVYAEARGWTAREYVDHGVSGAKESRPALDQLLKDARRRRFDVLVVWRLDRLGRNLRHLVLFLDELQALGVAFVTLGETGGSAGPTDLSLGISKALFHTLLGLLLAIPCVLAASIFRARLDRLCNTAMAEAAELVDRLPEGAKSGTGDAA
jgi:DNA invertase Pin-like site-specific DNA recombinase